MASIERYKSNRWRARYRTPDGKGRSQVFARKLDAQRWLAEVEHSKLAGSYVDPKAGRITFRAYAEAWRTMQPHRDGTTTSVEQQVRRHVYPAIGDRSIGAILPSEIQALVTHMSQSLAASTIAVIYGRTCAVDHCSRHRSLARGRQPGACQGAGVGDAARSPPLLRLAADPPRCKREDSATASRAALGEDDVGHVRCAVAGR
jgi:hypothetical protein